MLFFAPFQVEEGAGLGLDKAAHFLIFAILAFYANKAYHHKLSQIFLLLAAYALLVEHVQGTYLDRSKDWYDAIAGIIGLCVIYLHKK